MKLCETSLAAVQLASPAWLAVIEQVPIWRSVSEVPETVQTLVVVEAKATVRPEVAVADKVSGEAESEALGNAAKLIVCPPETTVML